jgi:hypothetical protein
MKMLKKNSKLAVIWNTLQAIANAPVNARLKYAANMNRALIERPVAVLEKTQKEPAERESEWNAVKDQLILEHCLKDEKTGTPLIFMDGYQFKNKNEFQALLDATKVRDFKDVHEAHLKRDQDYARILDEEVDISDFPYKIKWSFVDLDEKTGDFKGITGEQMYVLMSNGMMDGEPPWMNEEPGQKSSLITRVAVPNVEKTPATAEKE